MIKNIVEFVNREHIRILVAIIILLIALVLFIEYTTLNGESLNRIIIDYIRNLFS